MFECCMYIWICRVYDYVYVSTFTWLCVSLWVFSCVLWISRPVWWDPDQLQEIWIGVRYGPDIVEIRRLIHGMICRSVPVCAVKTRWWLGSKTTSFHVSVCSHIFCYLSLPIDVHVLIHIISCDHLIYFTSMIDYLYHFMRHSEYLLSHYCWLSLSPV